MALVTRVRSCSLVKHLSFWVWIWELLFFFFFLFLLLALRLVAVAPEPAAMAVLFRGSLEIGGLELIEYCFCFQFFFLIFNSK